MERDQLQRRALGWGAVGAGAVMVPWAFDAAINQTIWTRVLSFVLSGVAVALTISATLVHFMTRVLHRLLTIEKVWNAGFDAGRQATGCSMFRPALQLVNDLEKEPASVAHLSIARR